MLGTTSQALRIQTKTLNYGKAQQGYINQRNGGYGNDNQRSEHSKKMEYDGKQGLRY